MMIRTLTRIFANDLSSVKYIKRPKKQKILIQLASVIGVLAMFGLILSPILAHAQDWSKVVPLNIGFIIMNIGILIMAMVSLISSFGFTYSIGYLDRNLDNYIFMPITMKELVFAKFITVYRSTLMIMALGMVPFTILAIAFSGFDFWLILAAVLYLFTMPLFTGYLACLIIGTVMYFLNKVKNKSRAKNGLYGAFILLIMASSMSISFLSSNLAQDPMQALNFMNTVVTIMRYVLIFPILALEVFNTASHINVLWMLLISTVGILTVFYLTKIYYQGARGFAADTFTSKGKKVSDSQIKSRGMIKWFFFIEAKQIFKTSVYFFNTVFSNIIIVVIYLGMLGYAYFVNHGNDVTEIVNFIRSNLNIYFVFLGATAITCFFSIFNHGAATCYSRESYNLDALKTMPIDMRSAFIGKVLFHFIIEYLTSFVFIVLPIIVLGLGAMPILVTALTVLLVSLAFIFLPVILDLKYPTLGWESEVMVVKRSKSIILSLIICLILAIIFIGGIGLGLFFFNLSKEIVSVIVLIVLVGMFIGLYSYYKKLIYKVFS